MSYTTELKRSLPAQNTETESFSYLTLVTHYINMYNAQYVNNLLVEGGLVVLANRSMPMVWLLALPIDCVLGEAEGDMPISFRRWSCTMIQQSRTVFRKLKTQKFIRL